jgi:polyisoprenoid-binding protein YceI
MNRIARMAAVLAAALPALALAEVSTWNVDSSHSRTGFSVKHLVISDVKGEFANTAGKVQLDDQDLSKSSVDVTIDANSIDTRDAKRDTHVRSADFLDVAKFPTITFKSTKVEPGTDGKLAITGNLTLHGVTKPVTIQGEITKPITDPWGNARRGFAGSTVINRKDFGVSWSKALDIGPVAGDEVKIDLQAEIVKEKAPAAK